MDTIPPIAFDGLTSEAVRSSVWHIAASIVVVGGGPAGLMAAEAAALAGHQVHLFDAMPSVGRKMLLAGRGGLNLTHSEPFDSFMDRFGASKQPLLPVLTRFGPGEVCQWAHDLGVPTFVGTSGRVFPKDMRAAPLLRAWLHRMRQPQPAAGQVHVHVRHRWEGWSDDGQLSFVNPQGAGTVRFGALVLALGGGSWARLGSDGRWVPWLQAKGVGVAPLRPSNCGFDVVGGWSPHFQNRFAGLPFKSVALRVPGREHDEAAFERRGEFVATNTGIEGSLVYAASAMLRDQLAEEGRAALFVDLLPDWSPSKVLRELAVPRGSRSLSTHLKSRLGLDGIKAGLLYECLPKDLLQDVPALAAAIKAVPLLVGSTRPLDEAISSAGGVSWDAVDEDGMLKACPGVFCAGEMLDWEAPTGGYLLTACLSTGRGAGEGAAAYVSQLRKNPDMLVDAPVDPRMTPRSCGL